MWTVMAEAQIFVGPRNPYDKKVKSPHLLLRVFEARTLLISNPAPVKQQEWVLVDIS